MGLKVHDQEIVLQRLWKSRRLFASALQTVTGKQVEVLYGGSENLDAGPDFREAVLKIAGVLLKGDVEVHLQPSGWYAHGHHQDSAYNRVILHVVSELPTESEHILREDGVRIEQLYVELDRKTIDLWKRPPTDRSADSAVRAVAGCPLAKRPLEKITATVAVAGELRLNTKSEQMQEMLSAASWDQVIYQKVLEALGYSKNQVPFRRLAHLVPFDMICREILWVPDDTAKLRCTALLFGSAGLLPIKGFESGGLTQAVRDYVSPLIDVWRQMQHRPDVRAMKNHEWQFFRLRPQNFPTRRLAGAVEILMRFCKSGFIPTFLKLIDGQDGNLKMLTREFAACFVQKAGGFWSQHYGFADDGGAPLKGSCDLIGRDRARDIVVNIVLPALLWYARDTSDGRLRNAVLELYHSHPRLPDNTITRCMVSQLCQNQAVLPNPFTTAVQQQGLITLHKRYCKALICSECLSLSKQM